MTIRSRTNFILPLAAALALLVDHASAVTYTWSGASNSSWSNSANWVGGVLPASTNTTDIIMSGTANVSTMYVGGVNWTLRSLTYDASNDADTRLSMTPTGNANGAARNMAFSSDSGNATLTVESGSTGNKTIDRIGTSNPATITLSSSLDVIHNGSGLLTLGNATNASVTGAGGINKSGTGTLTLSGANTYTGTTTINGGTLLLTVANALGSGSSIVVNSGGTLSTTANTGISANIGSFVINGGTFSVNSNQIITNGTAIIMTNATISGSTVLMWVKGGYVGAGTNAISAILDARANDNSGLFNITDGTTTVSSVFRGMVGIRKAGAGTLVFTAVNTTASNNALVISNGTLEIAGAGQLGSGATNSGTYGGNVTNAGTFAYSSSANQTMSGVISGAGNLTKSGNGTLTLSGTNTYTGATTVSAGSLIVNGSLGSSSVLTVAQSAIFGGSGVVGGAATISGILSPGNSPGTLTFSNNLTLNSTAETFMEIGGTTPGTGFDQILVSGTLAYNGKLTIASFGGWDLTQVNSYNLFDFGGYSGSLTNVNVGGFDLAWDNADTWTGTNGSTIYTFTENDGVFAASAVPEPSTYALLALSAAGFGWHVVRRRRR